MSGVVRTPTADDPSRGPLLVVPFRAEHAARLVPQPAQADAARWLAAADLAAVEAAGRAWSALDARTGDPIGIGGLAALWPGVAMAWSWLSAVPTRHMPALHRAVVRGLDAASEHRIEATVDIRDGGRPDRVQARWLGLLGFEPEGLRRGWRPDGRDMFAFARIRR